MNHLRSLRSNILLMIVLSIGSAMLLLGLALDFLVDRQYTEDTYIRFSDYFERTQRYFIETEHKLALTTSNLLQDKKFKSQLGFISVYEDLEDYQKMTFDQEKISLAKQIEKFSQVAQFDHVRLYNSSGVLIAFSDNYERSRKFGILSYNLSSPRLLSFLPDGSPYYKISLASKYWQEHMTISDKFANGIEYREDDMGFNVTYSFKLENKFQDGSVEHIGFIEVVKNISVGIFDRTAPNNGGFNLFLADSGVSLGQNPVKLKPLDLDSVDLFSEHGNTKLQLLKNNYLLSHHLTLVNGKQLHIIFGISKGLITSEINQLMLIVIYIFIVVSIIASLISFLYFRYYIGASINNIIAYADNIRDGNYDAPTPDIREYELNHLVSVLEHAAVKIRDREKELREIQSVLEHRVELRTNDLQQAKDEADKANLAKSQFLSSMSHELRTPLNAILGFAQVLEMDLHNSKSLTSIQEILNAGYHLLDLVNQVLDLSKIEAGHLNLTFASISLTDVLSECIVQIKSGIHNKNINIVNNVTDDSICMYADKTRLRQVLINILSNAIKYNCDNGSVTIDVELRENNKVYLSIKDTGLGIDKDQIGKLFDPFERLGFKGGSIDGTGIGLTVTKQLIDAMRGEIGVESKKGEGTTFWFTLSQSGDDINI